jgi:UDP-N-acetyl-D-mannosaminuronic acid dehydrogenase
MLATKGHTVVGVDVNDTVIKTINSGKIHIQEPDLDILVRAAVKSGNLKASLSPEPADTFIIAVPTPFMRTPENPKSPDMSHVDAAVRSIAPHLVAGNLVILESTSPVGTTARMNEIIAVLRPDLMQKSNTDNRKLLVHLAYCPERVLPGAIIRELVDNDRIVGGVDRESSEKARDLYRSFSNGDVFLTDSKTAELVKLAENAYRDVNIAFANELSLICDKLGINVWELVELANKHPRVKILKPGPGVGGHCIAVDPWFIVSAAPDESKIIRTAREVNDSKPRWVLEKVKKYAAGFSNPVIGCLGLTFKANVDDLRESPALEIARAILSNGIGTVMACDPYVNERFQELPLHDIDTVLMKADILVLLVDHEEFKNMDRARLRGKIVVDTRGIWR